jgi:hypothetical protein
VCIRVSVLSLRKTIKTMLNERNLDLAKLKKVIFNPKYTKEQRAKLCKLYAEKYLVEKVEILDPFELIGRFDDVLNEVPKTSNKAQLF